MNLSEKLSQRSKGRKWHLVEWLFLAILIIAAMGSIYRGYDNALSFGGSEDLQWKAAKILFAGENPYERYLEGEQRGWAYAEEGYIFFPNYPITGYLFLGPFAAFEWEVAKSLWFWTNVLGGILIVVALRKITPESIRPSIPLTLAIAAVFLLSAQTRDVLSMGQYTTMTLCAFLWAVVTVKKSPHLSGVLLAISLLKVTVTLPLLTWFIIRRQWSALVTAGLTHAVILTWICFHTKTSPVDYLSGFLEMSNLTFGIQGNQNDVFSIFHLADVFGVSGSNYTHVFSVLLVVATALFCYQNRKKLSDVHVLTLLCFPATLAWIHFRYDQFALIVVVFGALAVRQQATPFRVAAFVMLLGNWFAIRLLPESVGNPMISLLTWASWLVLFYLSRVPVVQISHHQLWKKTRKRKRSKADVNISVRAAD